MCFYCYHTLLLHPSHLFFSCPCCGHHKINKFYHTGTIAMAFEAHNLATILCYHPALGPQLHRKRLHTQTLTNSKLPQQDKTTVGNFHSAYEMTLFIL